MIPGAHNLGIFINVQSRDNEEYQLTHPAAHLGGLMRGSLSVTVSDTCFVTCPKSRLKVILQYLEEGWLGKPQNKVVGVIYRYNPETDNIIKIKEVPEADVLGRVEGCWRDQIYYTLKGSKVGEVLLEHHISFDISLQEPVMLVDLHRLFPVPKIIPPESEQLPNESLRFWRDVTQAIVSRQYGAATKLKTELEERQRDKAAARKAQDEDWKPRFFTGSVTPVGKPELTEDGRMAMKGLEKGNYHLEESLVTGA